MAVHLPLAGYRPDNTGGPLERLLLELLALALLVPAISVLHECGHALAAPLAGYRVTSLGVGVGKPFWRRLTTRGQVLWLGRWPLAGGACVAVPAGMRARPALYHAGGLLAQAGLALALHLLGPSHWILARAEVFNLLVLVWNAIPWRWQGLASDGWFLVARFGRGRPAMPVMGRRSVLLRLARFEEAVGSPLGGWYARLGLAWLDVLVGQPERADAFFELPEPYGLGAEDRGLRALEGWARVAWHLAKGQSEQALDEARAWRARLGSRTPDASEDMSTLAVARALLAAGQPHEARRVLASLAGVTGFLGREARAILLDTCLAVDDKQATARAAWRLVERLPGPFLDPVGVVTSLWQASEQLPSDEPAGPRFRLEAQRAAGRLLAWAEPQDRASLRQRLGSAVEETGTSLVRQGSEE